VIVEGYMDVIMAHQNGFTNVVAAMGTSLTEKQVGILARLTANFVLALDADAAGQTATLRGLEVAPDAMGEEATASPAWQGKVRRRQVDGRQVFYGLPTGAANIVAKRKGEIKVVELPRGQDPDDVIGENPAQWQELIAQSVPMMDFLFKSIQQRYDLTSPRGKDEAAKEVLPFIAELPSPIEQAHYLQRLATLIGVDESTLQAAMPRTGKRGNAERAGAAADIPQPVVQSEVLEDYCLALLFRFDFLRPQAVALLPEHFHSTEVRELFHAWQAGVAENYEETVDQALMPRLREIREKPLPPLTERMAQAALTQCIDRLEQRRLLQLKSQHRLRLAQEESGHGFEDPNTLVVEILEQEVVVNRQLDELMKRRRARPAESSLEGSAL
ncbi:MAG TPA: toprim domain-containing protein, partial [Dehalococcoidia bacterium]|nr:toprim domain-containing protein [Dehalococcoidia bacterium]